VKNPEGRRALVYPSVDGSMVLKQISKEWDWRAYTRFIRLRIETLVADSCEHGKKTFGLHKIAGISGLDKKILPSKNYPVL